MEDGRMNPFDQAWTLLKMPVYDDNTGLPPMQNSESFEMLPHLDKMGGFMWESEDGMARGTMRPEFWHNSLLLNNFEIGGPMRGDGHARNYFQQMIDEGHAHFDHELDGTHVTNVEPHTAGIWNKFVDEGIIDGAHEKGDIRISFDGDKHFTHAYDDERKQEWQHELNEEYAEYHGLPTEAYLDQYLTEPL